MTDKVTNTVFPQITNTVLGQIFPLKELRVRDGAEIFHLKEYYANMLSEVQSENIHLRNKFGSRVYDNLNSEISLHVWNSARFKEVPIRQLRWRIKTLKSSKQSQAFFVMLPLKDVLINSSLSNSLLVADMFDTLQVARKRSGSHLLDEIIDTEIKRLEINARSQLLRYNLIELDKLLSHIDMAQKFQKELYNF